MTVSSQLHQLQAVRTLPGIEEALSRCPTLPPLAAPDAPSLKTTAAFVGSLLSCPSVLAWFLLPRVF